MGKAVPALTHRDFFTGGPPAHYIATWARVRLRAVGTRLAPGRPYGPRSRACRPGRVEAKRNRGIPESLK
jgi:hypothetical protein